MDRWEAQKLYEIGFRRSRAICEGLRRTAPPEHVPGLDAAIEMLDKHAAAAERRFVEALPEGGIDREIAERVCKAWDGIIAEYCAEMRGVRR